MSEYVPRYGVDEDLVIGTPEGDGDFESDNLTATGETSSGGQLNTGEAERRKAGASRADVPGPQQPKGLEKVIDEISTGKIQP
jgi:hypothetical protein